MIQKYLINVVPLTKIPLTKQPKFSYLFNQELNPGDLVKINFANRNIFGVVLDSKIHQPIRTFYKLKYISSVVWPKLVTNEQLQLAAFFSEYYFTPLGQTLKTFIPKTAKARKSFTFETPKPAAKNLNLTLDQKNAVSEIIKSRKKKLLLMGPASSGKTEVYIHVSQKINDDGQTLILIPELSLSTQTTDRLRKYYQDEEIVVLHSHLTDGQYFENWQKVASGKAKIIIGTRMAIFAPFSNLKLIVIDEEQDISFKQWDMSPKYDARTLAEKLSEIFKCKLIFSSATPRIESYYKAKTKEYKLITLPHLILAKVSYKRPNVEIVNMRFERYEKNYSPISRKLEAEIRYALSKKLQVILFINRQGMSSFSVCKKCKAVFKCPKCERALVYNKDANFRCLHCSHKTDIIPTCASCGSGEFQNVGYGTEKVEKEANKLFPGAKVARADTTIAKKTHEISKIYQKMQRRQIDILVGSQMITKGWDLPNIGLIGIIDIESELSLPDFRACEKAFANCLQAMGRTSRINSKFTGQAVLQSFNPESSFVQNVANFDYRKFYQEELEDREALRYPPFVKLIKLTFQDENLTEAQKRAKKIHKRLAKIQETYYNSILIYEPQIPLINKIRGRFKVQILIKIKLQKTLNLAIFSQELKKVAPDCIIDIDTLSVV